MYSLENGLAEILRMADLPRAEIDFTLMQARILEFASVLDKCGEVPAAVIELMPNDMKKSCISVALGALLAVVQEGVRK